MLNQYTWWDFAKVVGVAVVVYYIYVFWKYYREDIREWIANRGTKPAKSDSGAVEEEDSSGLYSVKNYENRPYETLQMNPATAPDEVFPSTSSLNETELTGIAIYQDAEFTLPLQGTVQRSTERSLSELLNTAQRIMLTETGKLSSKDPSDTEADKLATVINQQKESKGLLTGIPFTR
ncbi:hypothetical protein GO755_27910 [Spirosoma sp. HMF4905]|uniref:Uncharacterized protein n=1 Tax=Spirosoma arboris TaxID=2682092 RepID=A0A7K1SJH5_9BACT|nr:hypothetical protein [Spirosoma arboris]MVM33894.1 hypothetical protein [Spirosoma arboris]